MSLKRRLAAGIPAVGVIAFTALAFSGTPALATGDGSARAGQPVVMATPCDTDARQKCDASSASTDGYGGGAQATDVPNDNATGNPTDDTRGNSGYGGESPSPSPSETTPTGTTDTVPPGTTDTVPPGGGESPGTTASTPGGGVSAGGNLPLTGAPSGATIGLGAAMVVAGAAAVWYTRRRRTA